MNRAFSAPATVLFEFDFALNLLLVLAGPIVYTLAVATGQFD